MPKTADPALFDKKQLARWKLVKARRRTIENQIEVNFGYPIRRIKEEESKLAAEIGDSWNDWLFAACDDAEARAEVVTLALQDLRSKPEILRFCRELTKAEKVSNLKEIRAAIGRAKRFGR